MGVLGGLLDRLNETIVIDSRLCSRVRNKKSECSDCMDACAQGAVSITKAGGKVLIDWDKCTACGECYSACKSGVFQIKLADKSRLFSTLKESISEDSRAVFACKDKWGDKTIGVPTLAYVDRKILVKAALAGAERIILQTGDCGECKHKCMATAVKEMRHAEDIFASADRKVTIETAPYEKEVRSKAKKRLEDSQLVSRREFFSLMGRRTKKSVGQVVYSLSENDANRAKTVLTGSGVKRRFADDIRLLGGEELLGKMREGGMMPSVCVDSDKCRKCGVCERMCAFGVYTCEYETVKGRKKIVNIKVDQDSCTGCGICALSCMAKAITVQGVKA
jgi:NAD-dependent dihydropyrimidine dehydrogenase PreA subunit